MPRYITPQQVVALLDAVTSEKHRLMMLIYYATGMRLSEVRLLLWEDVNFEEGVIFVKKGKGAKDPIVVKSDTNGATSSNANGATLSSANGAIRG